MAYRVEVERGRVVNFDYKGMFGFIKPERGGKWIFFHYSCGQYLRANGDRLEWGPPPVGTTMRMPKVGDRIVFGPHGFNYHGQVAATWTYEEVYNDAILHLLPGIVP